MKLVMLMCINATIARKISITKLELIIAVSAISQDVLVACQP
jgi:hypothetical protein